MTLHSPQRPSWVCAACELPYPCRAALATLAAGDALATQVYLAGLFVSAVDDLPAVSVADLYARFLLAVPVRRSQRRA
ncbi:hypothetical protein TPA0908_07190 [Micromonospora sp. AKA38]|nr:hypothetical protein TPA0908_07190 [Micromonospora sp. AKA38]